MEERSRFIAPQRMGAWVIVALGTAILAFLLGVVALREARTLNVASQVEVIKLADRIVALEKRGAAPAPVPAPAAPAK